MTPDDPRHGQNAGWDAHRADDEEPCQPCRDAAAAYEYRRRIDAYLGKPRTLSPVGSTRRIRGLVAIGYTFGQIGDALDVGHDQPRKWANDQRFIRSSSAARIAALYDAWWDTPPAEVTGRDKWRASYARTTATRNGWHTPTAWFGVDIDDPAAEPDPGWKERRRTFDEMLEDFAWLVEQGESEQTAADRLGVRLSSIRDQRSRHERDQEAAA